MLGGDFLLLLLFRLGRRGFSVLLGPLLQLRLMVRAFGAVVHDKVALFIQLIHLLLVSDGVVLVELFVFFPALGAELVPEGSALLHGFGVSAAFLLFDLVYFVAGEE